MITTRNYQKQIWFELQNPSKEDIDSIVLAENVSRVIAEDLFAPSPLQSTREFEDATYIVLHIPNVTKRIENQDEFEIDIVIGKDLLVTVTYNHVDALHFLGKEIEVGDMLASDADEGHLFFILMRTIYQFLTDEVSFLISRAKDIEKRIFAGNEKEMVLALSVEMRNVTNFKQTLIPHKKIWAELSAEDHHHIDREYSKRMCLLSEDLDKLLFTIENTGEIIKGLSDTNNSLLSARQNNIMKTLTVMAFIVLPLSLISSIFGMNVTLPWVPDGTAGFWIVLAILLVVGLMLTAFFKHKKWF